MFRLRKHKETAICSKDSLCSHLFIDVSFGVGVGAGQPYYLNRPLASFSWNSENVPSYLGRMAVIITNIWPWLVWLSRLSQRVIGSIPSQGTCLGCRPGPQSGGACARSNHTLMFLSFSFSFPSLSLKINE